jgi:hypothetical protein
LAKVTKVEKPNAKRQDGFVASLAAYLLYHSYNNSAMALGDELLKKISQKFEPSTKVLLRYKGNDLALVTDGDGNAMQLFMGKAGNDGTIKGDRYARTLKYDREGRLIKDHWERKGKAT